MNIIKTFFAIMSTKKDDLTVLNGQILIWGKTYKPVQTVIRNIPLTTKWIMVTPEIATHMFKNGILLEVHTVNAASYTHFYIFPEGNIAKMISTPFSYNSSEYYLVIRPSKMQSIKFLDDKFNLLRTDLA